MSSDFPLVAVAADLGPRSEGVARAGAEIAAALGGRAVLLHSLLATPGIDAYQRVVARLDILAHSVGDVGFEVLSGPASRSVNEWVEAVDADVIVTGARVNVPRFERTFATIDGLLRQATRPVWVVRPDLPFPPSRPLFAVSAAESSDLALETGIDHLRALGWMAGDRGRNRGRQPRERRPRARTAARADQEERACRRSAASRDR